MLSHIGLLFIIFGWLIQLKNAWAKKSNIKTGFMLLYSAGVLLLVIDGFMNGLLPLALLNLISLVVAALVLFKSKKDAYFWLYVVIILLTVSVILNLWLFFKDTLASAPINGVLDWW